LTKLNQTSEIANFAVGLHTCCLQRQSWYFDWNLFYPSGYWLLVCEFKILFLMLIQRPRQEKKTARITQVCSSAH